MRESINNFRSAGRIGVAVSSAILLASCASDWQRSYERWIRYKLEPGPYMQWAICIEGRSYHHLEADLPRPAGEEAGRNRAQLFTHVLEDCQPLMSGQEWNDLSRGQIDRLIADAHQAFESIEAEIRVHSEFGMISGPQR